MIMKKLFTLLLMMLLPLMASADAVEIDGLYYNLNSDDKVAELARNPNNYSGDVLIPAKVSYDGADYNVTSIGESAFYNCIDLISITIGNSVTRIEERAFNGCIGLESFIVDESNPTYSSEDGVLMSMGGKVIVKYPAGKKGTAYTIPNSVTSIGRFAFYQCSGLTSVTIPNSVVWIGESAFHSCSGLTSVEIPNGVTSIGDYTFVDCSSLTSVTIPNSVTSIGGGAFLRCQNLTSITIPSSVTSIGGGAFIKCNSLTSITIPNNVTSIDDETFQDCIGLTSVTIGNGVTNIGYHAFYRCSNLTSVTIGSGINFIGESSFRECPKLADVYCFAQSVKNIYYNAFKDSNTENATLHVPAGSVETYKAASPWNKFKEIVEIEDEPFDGDVIKITSAGQTTWCSAYDLDFTDVEGLKAYTATGYNRTSGTIWLTRVKEVPANEGILLIGDEGEYKVPHVATTAYYANLMVGTVKAITINETEGEYTNYYLSNGASGVGFYKVNGSVDIKANRAYLPLLKNTVSGSRGFIGIDFDDDADGTTNVQSSMFNLQSDEVYYNLQGQRVENPSKGLYIKNGKKVLIK